MRLVGGVDSSTRSTKVQLRDLDSGLLVAAGSAPHPAVTPPIAEQHPDAWWSAFEDALSAAVAVGNLDRRSIVAISVAGQQHGLVGLDEGGDVLAPAKLWCDTTADPDAEWLVRQHPRGATGWADRCGSVPVAAFTVSKLSWLHRTHPGAWARLATVLLPHDWITYRLTGSYVTDRGDASGTGYFSAAENRYCPDLLDLVDSAKPWPDMLPRVLAPTEAAGEWHGAVVGPGTGDNMAAAVGIGLRVGDVAVSVGTSGTVFTVSDRPTNDEHGVVAGFADATGRHLPLVCTMNATKVTDAVARWCRLDHDELSAAALRCPPGASGLTLLPYFDGERTPNRPDATGVLAGIRSDTPSDSLVRAAFEGVVCGLLDALDALSLHARCDGRLLLVGGGAKSPAYRSVLADLSGRVVVAPQIDEAVAAGACVQAAAVLADSSIESVRSGWATGGELITEPTPGSEDVRSEIRQRYARLRD